MKVLPSSMALCCSPEQPKKGRKGHPEPLILKHEERLHHLVPETEKCNPAPRWGPT